MWADGKQPACGSVMTPAATPTGCVVLNMRSIRYVPGWSITGHGRKNENGIDFHWRHNYAGDSVSSGGVGKAFQ